ncbi:hypothetical protein IE53DRAFT_316718 [Violaceomyces palustris]|uniref:Uncharacterized protein n=1 Tax=Violaceomyces palustris TaxID=1673888 RepID=A0ACD0NVU4_9BASI|nr:hypothetical protein IE53DRAFT_316718 [Violaceomyces palustris]
MSSSSSSAIHPAPPSSSSRPNPTTTTATAAHNLNSIEDALSLILDCAGQPQSIGAVLIPSLNKLCRSSKGAGEQVLCSMVQADRDPLGILDPVRCSVGMIYILVARLSRIATLEEARNLAGYIQTFVRIFDPVQLRLAGEKVTQFARLLPEMGQGLGDPNFALPHLENLFLRFTENAPCLTTLHPILAYQYLRAGQYATAYDHLLQTDIIDADSNLTPLRYTDVLEYFYYGGLICTKLKKHTSAIEFFETCVSSPAAAVSAIQVDAYKKLILVRLIKDGQMSPPPKYTSGAFLRSFKQTNQTYLSFAAAYESREPAKAEEVMRIAQEKAELFSQDCNMGLVQQCLALHRQRRIQRLKEVYSTLSLANVAEILGVTGEDAEGIIEHDVMELVSKGWIHARIVPATEIPPGNTTIVPSADEDSMPILCFEENPDRYDSAASIDLLTKEIKLGQHWQGIVNERERELARSYTFLSKVGSNVCSSGGFGGKCLL